MKIALETRRRLWALALMPLLVGAAAHAADHAIGIRASHFSPEDTATEETFDVDPGPVPGRFYTLRDGAHGLAAAIARDSWSREDQGSIAELGFVPLTVAYRYHVTPTRTVSAFAGGGAGFMVFDASVDTPDELLIETGYATALEPAAGVVLFPSTRSRVELEAKYSWQVFSAEDLDLGFETIDVDMSGFHLTRGVAMRVGS